MPGKPKDSGSEGPTPGRATRVDSELATVVGAAVNRVTDERSVITLVYLVFVAALYPCAMIVGGAMGATLLILALACGTGFVFWLLVKLTRKKRAESSQVKPGWKLRIT